MKVSIIGGGAAGFFAAIATKENYPNAKVVIFEKSNKLLAKVKVSGGGRCNVTNGCTSIPELCKAYPRGGKQLKKAFHTFNTKHTMEWFKSREVPLRIEENNHVFPASNNSQTIIDCLIGETKKLGITIYTGSGINSLEPEDEKITLHFQDKNIPAEVFDKVIIATGGSPKRSGLSWLEELGHTIENPVPSLFTFNMPKEPVKNLMGVAVENAMVKIQGTKLSSNGPLLITHWGMSGPAILKLSAFGARVLADMDYSFNIQINWINEQNQEEVMKQLSSASTSNPQKMISNYKPFSLPERLWNFLLAKCEILPEKKWGEIGKKGFNKLTNILTNDIYQVKGKTTFKEEFVTCGGVSLQSIDFNTMQSRVCKNLYFAGEVMDVDAITGGFNFQAAWTTGFIAGQLNE